jgi:hypothetical protein
MALSRCDAGYLEELLEIFELSSLDANSVFAISYTSFMHSVSYIGHALD